MNKGKVCDARRSEERSIPYSIRRTPYLYQILSGLLLALSFPFPGWGFLAWFALVPLLASVHHAQSGAQALGFGLISGIIFFLCSLHWLTHVSTVGWLIVVLMQAAYIMVFAGLAYAGMRSCFSAILRVLWIACAWTGMEFFRSEVPIFGFGWNLIAYSQSSYLPIIQVANILGAYGLGFLVAWGNAAIFCAWFERKARLTAFLLLGSVVLVPAGLWGYGRMTLAKPVNAEEYLRVSVVQGNIPQSVKWELMAKEKILEIYEKLTQLAALEQPDLIVWPEAAFPGYFNRDLQAERIARLAQGIQTPLLIGGLEWESERESYNSAYFLNKDGGSGQRYDKLRLVPFGEYIPFKAFLGWMTPIADALGISDFRAGARPVVFRWAREVWPFGVLICFEDIFPDLARDLTDRGAKFLVMMTNDAWFGKTSAPFQHLQATIFRALENGVPIARAANTGVSAFVSHQGRVLALVKDEREEKTFVMGQKTLDLPLMMQRTIFSRGGYLFPYFIMGILGIMALMFRGRSRRI